MHAHIKKNEKEMCEQMSSSDNIQLRVCQVLINTLGGAGEEPDSLHVGVAGGSSTQCNHISV